MVHDLVSGFDMWPQRLAEVLLSSVNRRILMDTRAGMFVTVFYGIRDPVTGRLMYCNAGHNPPYILSAQNNHAVQALSKPGMALGVTEEATWTQGSFSLPRVTCWCFILMAFVVVFYLC